MTLFGRRKSRACKHEGKHFLKLCAADKTSLAVHSKCSWNGWTRYSSVRYSHAHVAPAVATSIHPSSICSAIHHRAMYRQTASLTLFGLTCRSVPSGRGHRCREVIKPTTLCHHHHHHQGGSSGDAPFAAAPDHE